MDIKDYLDSDANYGVRVVVDRVAARETLAARDETLAARDLVLPARDQTLAARDETLQHGITVDTSVGTRIYVGDTMIHGDTGWRDISHLLSNATADTPLRIRRTGAMVTLDLHRVQPTENLSSGSSFISSLPNGFRPNVRRDFALRTNTNSSTLRSAFQFPTGAIGCWAPSASDLYYHTLTYPTSDPWPTSLPGNPL